MVGAPAPDLPRLHASSFRGRTWITRPRPGIDRIASAWLIRRFIAKNARFEFQSQFASGRDQRVPFDMPDAEFGHRGTDCTFETLTRRFGIRDAGVAALSQIVHDLDLKENRYAMPESPAVSRLVEGLRLSYSDDGELLRQGMAVMEAFYQSFTAERGRRPKKS